MSALTTLRIAALAALILAATIVGPGWGNAAKGKRYALLVGIRLYDHGNLAELKYTENDVEEFAEALTAGKGQFAEMVILTTTRGEKNESAKPTIANIRARLRKILDKVKRDDMVIVGLAGHGMQLSITHPRDPKKEKEESFFCPCDARPKDTRDVRELSKTMLSLSELFAQLDESGAGVKLLLVDACRNEPRLGRSVDADNLPRAPRGTAALFSCKGGEQAFETAKLGKKGHGVFFHFVIEGIKSKARNERNEVTWGRLSEYVKEKVPLTVTNLFKGGARQTPQELLNLEGTPVLAAFDGAAPTNVAQVKEPPTHPTVTNSIGLKLVRIPAGKFVMGSSKEERASILEEIEDRDEKKKYGRFMEQEHSHTVTLKKPFYMGVYEVTQKEYRTVMGNNRSHWSDEGPGYEKVRGKNTDEFPVERVKWSEAQVFCDKLSALPAEKKAGRKYRLPTEAEWEYCCRAGTTTAFHFGKELTLKMANFGYQVGEKDAVGMTTRVGKYPPNAFGLYDMHGNVWEWCGDYFDAGYYQKSPNADPTGPSSGTKRILRGGAWNRFERWCRSAHRGESDPEVRYYTYGFRVVCEVAE